MWSDTGAAVTALQCNNETGLFTHPCMERGDTGEAAAWSEWPGSDGQVIIMITLRFSSWNKLEKVLSTSSNQCVHHTMTDLHKHYVLSFQNIHQQKLPGFWEAILGFTGFTGCRLPFIVQLLLKSEPLREDEAKQQYSPTISLLWPIGSGWRSGGLIRSDEEWQ